MIYYILHVQDESETASDVELRELKESLADTPPVGALVKCARTLDQVKSIHVHMHLAIPATDHDSLSSTCIKVQYLGFSEPHV